MWKFETLRWIDVKPIWDSHLWPGRDSEPVTSMKYLGGYDMEYKNQKPKFIGFTLGGQIVATNSYVRTTGTEWRSRGLWVHEDFRGQGNGELLLECMLKDIREEGGNMVWTLPRKEALGVYEKVGFIRSTGWKEHDWGTNCYAIACLGTLEEVGKEATRIRERRIEFYHKNLAALEGQPMEEARAATRALADIEEAEWR
ncbi:hypothetical protein AMJ86_07825 [bacterium SM23_57]|nr:MAG: hypothetical protein AMJ86_07825 [bacterium SM23_57]